MLWLRALLSFLACPAVVAGGIPLLLVHDHEVCRDCWALAMPALGMGSAALLWCVRDFYVSGRGTLAPWDPPKHLVVVGLYRFVRNPMYVAVIAILFGWALLFRSWPLTVYAVAVAIGFHLRVRLHEEPWLKRQFGAEWEHYATQVPRWLPTRLAPRYP